jgi:MarR family transcriptional regulator, organic hydroperoxide resistance regulator
MLDDEDLHLNNQLCFALYAATHAITRAYRGLLGDLGLTYPQYLVLLALMEQPTMTSGALARALKLDAGTLTPLLKRLATAGLVSRERRPEDERVVEIRLTPAGMALHDELLRAQQAVVCRTSLRPDEMAKLRSALQELTETLSAPEDAVLEPA